MSEPPGSQGTIRWPDVPGSRWNIRSSASARRGWNVRFYAIARRLTAIGTATIVLLQLCVAQAAGGGYGEKDFFRGMASASVDASVQSWRLGGGRQIVQRSFPITMALPATERMLVTLTAIPAAVAQEGRSIAGIPETRLGASYVVPGEKIWLSGAVSMPTGVKRLSREQAEIAAQIAQPVLGFPMPSMGHGLNTTIGCAYASSASRLIVFGFGAAFSTKGAYEPVAPSETISMTYAPGDEIAANIGVDYRSGLKTDRLSADYTVTYYFSDKLNGERFFQSGVKASLVIAGSHASGSMVHMARLRLDTRAQNLSMVNGREEATPSARQLSLLYSFTMPLRSGLSFTAGAEFRAMTSDRFPVNGELISTGGGTIGLFSTELRYSAASWCMVTPRATFGTGSVTMMNVRHAATGGGAGIGLKVMF